MSGAALGSAVFLVLSVAGGLFYLTRRRRRLVALQTTESIKAWRSALAKEGLLVRHTDIEFERAAGSTNKYVVLGEGSFGKVAVSDQAPQIVSAQQF